MRFLLILAAFGLGAAASAGGPADLHGGVNVGMMAADLPGSAYKNFACVDPKGKTLTGFADYRNCTADADGLREMRVAINEAGEDESLVAGHPVDITLGFDEAGRLARIDIVTKSKGPMFMRKKAFLLGLQAKARYGDNGWTCKEEPLAADEEPLGPTSVKEHCVKALGDRRVTVDRALFRKSGADAKAFTSQSHVIIDWAAK